MFESEQDDKRRYNDDPLHTEKIFTDRKIFFIDLKSNDRGMFLKVTEDVRGRRDTIMIPAECLDEIVDALHNVQDYIQEHGGVESDEDE